MKFDWWNTIQAPVKIAKFSCSAMIGYILIGL